MHHYAWNASGGRTRDWYTGKRDALKFDAEQYYEILREADEMESLITAHWAVMGEADPRHHTKLVVDEWGSWYASGTEPFAEALHRAAEHHARRGAGGPDARYLQPARR